MKDRTRMLTARPRSILLLVVILAALTLVLKGRKRRLERFLCGQIPPAPLNSAGLGQFGP